MSRHSRFGTGIDMALDPVAESPQSTLVFGSFPLPSLVHFDPFGLSSFSPSFSIGELRLEQSLFGGPPRFLCL